MVLLIRARSSRLRIISTFAGSDCSLLNNSVVVAGFLVPLTAGLAYSAA